MKILMVCLGNICRSPLAEGILSSKGKGLNIEVDSSMLWTLIIILTLSASFETKRNKIRMILNEINQNAYQ